MIRTCAITGASGLVGLACERYLKQKGYQTVKFVRVPQDAQSISFQLEKEIDPAIFLGVDALVHCAYDFKPRTWCEIQKINVQGSTRLFIAAHQAGVRKIVFISSVGAFEGCVSLYGKAKLAVEKVVQELGGVVIRPGIVYGDNYRGMYGSLYQMVRNLKLPFLPVFGGGTQPFYLVHVNDLAEAIEHAITRDDMIGEVIMASHPKPLAFRDILRLIAKRQGKSVCLLSVPVCLGLSLLKTAETLGLQLSFRSDSLVGMIHYNTRMDGVTVQQWNMKFRSFEED